MKPKIKTCTKLQLQLLSFCLLCLSGKTRCDENDPAVVTVEQGRDAVLPCSLSTKENIESKLFDWKKAAQKDHGQKEVFYYDAGVTYNNDRDGQSEEFKGRVFHFPEELEHGNASIIIRNTKVTDSGNYTCVFPHLQPRQTFHIKLVVEPVVVPVKEGRDALLPCSLSTEENIEQGYFDWNKVAQNNEKEKEVFRYEKGRHSPNFGSQDEGLKGRVSHFPQELKHGNASIIIRNTKMADSGDYTCTFTEPRRTFHIKLVVDPVLKDRTPEKKPGTCPKPYLKILRPTTAGMLLQCVVRGAFPKPKVEWKDSDGKILLAEEPQVTERGDLYDIILQTTVTKTDNYSCVSTQEEICHQISDTYVPVTGAAPKPVIRTLDQTDNWALLQCEVNGNPQPKVEWRDSAGNTLRAEEPQVTQEDGRFYVTLNTTVNKTNHYRCVATQKNISHEIYTETFVRMNGPTDISVYEGDAVTLPCSLSTKKNIESEMFEWKKDGQKVFLYDAGITYNKGRAGQSEEFKGRVFHYPHKLKRGDASMTIRNTKLTDSGNYTCDFPNLQPRQMFHIELEVVNSGSGANSSESTSGWVGVVVGVIVTFVCTLLVVGVILAVLIYKGCFTPNCKKGSPADPKEGSAVPLNGQPSRSQEAPDPET